ncbi:glycoside hydrolase family 3 N-terminal domain-containing protein, partial [Jatrophihabitans endophyticus]|uniref:glycoside hydrolase family 3 N-terminal domain-containing protein n=1 Tax=Jatrophihabitans endophyticus TaxID=1206085 RepID=UPI0019DBDBA8
MTADPNIRAQAATVLARLSLPQKVGQLNQVWAEEIAPGTDPVEQIRQGQVGSMLYVLDPAKANALQRIAVEESAARIPLLFGSDVAHGFRTIFPVSLALAASWDPEVVVEAQTIAAKEARAAGLHWTFYPMVDIARDPRWGRIVEGVGEDPFLGSVMAAAHVRGLQGAMIGDADRLMATAKHFV